MCLAQDQSEGGGHLPEGREGGDVRSALDVRALELGRMESSADMGSRLLEEKQANLQRLEALLNDDQVVLYFSGLSFYLSILQGC